jgi:hypothetical protein
MRNLTEIANRNHADKGTEWFEKHSYTETYCNYIPSEGPCRLLEIGIWHGDSLRMWKEYNPEMKLWGMDINDCSSFFDTSLCEKAYVLDQTNRDHLNLIATETTPLDFVIDDGAHQMPHQHISLAILLKSVKSGGIYFIEDLHTCPLYANEARTDYLFQNWITTGSFASPFLTYEENEFISKNIKDVEFFNNGKLVKMVKV